MAGVKFDAHYRITSVDPPELVRFIKKQYPDVSMDYPRDSDGEVVSMWSLIRKNTMPPTRMFRYCCEKLKEGGGEGRLTVTGVRWAESVNRKKNHGEVTIFKKGGKAKEIASSPDYQQTPRGGVVLLNDNSESRRLMEQCVIKGKVTLNPIIDWEEDDVWEFLNEWAKVPHCELYDQGFTRLGCIGCPMSGTNGMLRDFNRWPKYKDSYIRAFQKMLQRSKTTQKGTKWETGEDVMNWWIGLDRRI